MAFIVDEFGGNWALATADLAKGSVVVNALKVKQRERFSTEIFLQAVFDVDQDKVILFVRASSSLTGFDQIILFDPSTAEGTFAFYNLMEYSLGFECDPSTKTCDALQTACYDTDSRRLYFQSTHYNGDDIDSTTIQYADVAAKYPLPSTALEPFTFGFMTFQYVSVIKD